MMTEDGRRLVDKVINCQRWSNRGPLSSETLGHGRGAGFYSVSAFAFGICRWWSNCSDISLWQVGLKISFHRSPQRSPKLHVKFPDPWIHQNCQIIDAFTRKTLFSEDLFSGAVSPMCTISCPGNWEAGVCWHWGSSHPADTPELNAVHCKCEHFELQLCSSPVAFLQHISCPVARFQFRAEAALALFNSAPINIKS